MYVTATAGVTRRSANDACFVWTKTLLDFNKLPEKKNRRVVSDGMGWKNIDPTTGVHLARGKVTIIYYYRLEPEV